MTLKLNPPAMATLTPPKRLRASVRVSLLAPLFGGGARTKVTDRDQWLRPAAVRGALRFWWRATHGASLGLAEMRKQEGILFGAAASGGSSAQGALALTVRDQTFGRSIPCNFGARDSRAVAYFSGQVGGGSTLLLESGEATLELSESRPGRLDAQCWTQILDALTAFLLFGGAGARWRKTAGSIGPVANTAEGDDFTLPTTTEELQAWFRRIRSVATQPCDQFALTNAKLFTGPGNQMGMLDMWKRFRQDRESMHHRTKWPAPDAIRVIQSTYAKWADGTHHAPRRRDENRVQRAHLGLPIVFKFRYDNTRRPHPKRGRQLEAEPRVSEVGDRYASPVVLSLTRLGTKTTGLVLITPSILRPKLAIPVSRTRRTLVPGSWADVENKLLDHLTTRFGTKFARIA